MVWEKDAPNAGFSTGKPWLPVKAPQAAKAVDQQGGADSILSYFRAMIARRKASPALSRGKTTFLKLPEPILAFTRTAEGETLTCLFNLSPDTHSFAVTGKVDVSFANNAALAGGKLILEGTGFVYLTHDTGISVKVL